MHAALKPIAEQVIVNGLLSKKPPLMRKNKIGLGLLALSGFLCAVAILFLTLSLYGWALISFTQPVAALVTAASVFTVSLLALGTGVFFAKHKSKQQAKQVLASVSELTDFIADELSDPIQENPKTAIALASLAGFMAGDRLQ